MEKGRADTEGGSTLFVRPTVLDAGIRVRLLLHVAHGHPGDVLDRG
ncbi:MAG: hypothetical protein ACLSVD_04280 [Eggerthellaceae bacterium]